MNEETKSEAVSEFGKGLCYCLALFLEHKHKLWSDITIYAEIQNGEGMAVSSWFNGAGDHLFEFQAELAPEHLRERCEELKKKVIDWRYAKCNRENAEWAISESEELIRLIDEHNNIPTNEATWK